MNSHVSGAVSLYCQGSSLSELTNVKKKTTGLLGAEAAVSVTKKW